MVSCHPVMIKIFKIKRPTFYLMGCLWGQDLAQAKDLGVYGQTFEIAEVDLLEQIEGKLQHLEQDGSLQKIQQQHIEQARRSVHRPKFVKDLAPATHVRSWLHDPSLIIAKDIKDHKGQVIARAGTHINPLDTVAFKRPFVFLDSDDPEQLTWLKASFDLAQDRIKVILVKGAPLELSQDLKMPIYFDQGGRLTHTFKIKGLPAVVRQEGRQLRIEEICLKDLQRSKTSQQDKQQAAANHQSQGESRGFRDHDNLSLKTQHKIAESR